jgi:ribosomal 30S subunit maturation factor RimM
MEVFREDGHFVGRVSDLMRTGGPDLLVVLPPGTEPAQRREGKEEQQKEPREILIPLARGIVLEVDDAGRRITIRPPEGLLELNAAGTDGEAEEAGR